MSVEEFVPKQVQDDADLAEKLFNEFHKLGQEDKTPEPETPPTETTPIEPEPQQQPEPEPEPAKPERLNYEPDPDDLTFKQKYSSLKGKYETEVPRMAADIRELKQLLSELQTAKPDPVKDTQSNQPNQTEEDDIASRLSELYGEELVTDLVKLIQRETAQSTKQVSEKLQTVEETQIESARSNFKSYLDGQLNQDVSATLSDPRFSEFLQQTDPSGLYTYADLYQLYNNAWDADKMVKLFNTFYSQSAEPAPQQSVAPKQPPKPTPEQEALVAPSRVQSNQQPTATDKTIWTKEKMDQFQKDDMRGKYSEAESQALWNDLLKAMSEGRIRG